MAFTASAQEEEGGENDPAPSGDDGSDDPQGEESAATTAPGSETPPPPTPAPGVDLRDSEAIVNLDLVKDKDIKEFIELMSKWTNRNFLVDKSISGTVTLVSPAQVTVKQAYDIFLSVLAVNGFTTVDVGKVTKIIPRKDAKQNPIPTISGKLPRDNDAIITQLIPLINIDCNDVAQAFANLIGSDGDMFAYGPSNMVIISDSASNVQRLYRIIQQLDQEGAEQNIEVIPLEYANAEVLAEIIVQLFEEGVRKSMMTTAARRFSSGRTRGSRRSRIGSIRGAGRSSSVGSTNIPTQTIPNIIADTRTNSLVVKSSSFGIGRVRQIVKKLDQPLPGGEGKIHVIYLQNADAEELAMTLADLSTGSTGGTGISSRNSKNKRGGLRGGRTGIGSKAGNLAGRMGGLAGRLGSRGQMAGGGTGRGGIASTSGRLFADFDGAVRITADPPTNSLVIVASPRDFKIMKEVIDKLDIPRRQVYVEAVIMEITMERGLDLGFEFRSTNDPGDDGIQVIGGSNYGGIQNAAANPLGISGFALGAVDGTITYGGQEFPNIGALFRAFQTDRDINVLSTPNILTMDNEESEIVVADNIPFITGQIFSANNSNPTTTIERQDVGITLRITPQINESDFVRLEIYQESSNVTDSPEGLAAAEVGITTSKRTTTTLVVVKDRQCVIIGGLMKDNVSVIDAKVPVLGDIPVLGYLFKSSRRKVEKTNLLIFLTPYVIKDATDLEEVTRMSNRRMRTFREKNKSVLRSDLEDEYLNNRTLTPADDKFKAPRADVIETDPRLRNQGEGDSTPPPGEGAPPDSDDSEDDTDQPFEDLTEDTEE